MRLTRLHLAALALASLAAGCSGSSSDGGGSGPAQFTQTTPDAFTQFLTPPAGAQFPGPQSAVVSRFDPGSLFVGYNSGTQSVLFKLDISSTTIQQAPGSPYTLPGSSSQLPVSDINLQDASTGLICVSDSGTGDNPVVHLFNPATISSAAEIIPLDLSAGSLLDVVPLQGAVDSDGQPVTQTYRANFPIGAAIFTIQGIDTLFVGFSNQSASGFPINNPGTVLIFDIDFTQSPPAIVRSGTLFTQRFNPTAMRLGNDGNGPVLYVTCEGGGDASFADLTGSLEVFDPLTATRLGGVDLGITDPITPLELNDLGDFGYIAGNPINGTISIHEIDIINSSLSQTLTVQEQQTFANFSNRVATNASGDLVYIQLPADRTISVIARSTGQVIDTITTPAPPGRSTQPFIDAPNYLVRRPGDPASLLFSLVGLQSGQATLDVIVPSTR